MWTKSAFLKMVLKLTAIRDVINCGYNLLYVDSDVLLFHNPFPKLQEYRSYDIVAQRDTTLCAGFMYLMPTITTKHLLYNSIYTMYHRSIMDQDALYWRIINMSNMKFAYLPSDLFMSGKEYAQTHQFFWDRNENDTNIISYHNNFIIMISNKLYRWREQGFYLEDKDGSYYSTPPGGYVLIDNVSSMCCVLGCSNIVDDLPRLATLVIRLNRTLIMQTMACPPSINKTYCNICSWDDICAYGFQRAIHFRFRAHVRKTEQDDDVLANPL